MNAVHDGLSTALYLIKGISQTSLKNNGAVAPDGVTTV